MTTPPSGKNPNLIIAGEPETFQNQPNPYFSHHMVNIMYQIGGIENNYLGIPKSKFKDKICISELF